MIGIDVIDRQQIPEFGFERRQRFLKKVFSLQERALIDSSANVDLTIWRLWSMKESAYKILNRTANKRSFSPVKLICDILSDSVGQVRSGNQLFYTRTMTSAYTISTVATNSLEDHFDKLLFKMDCKNYIEQSNTVYQKLMEKIAEIYQIPVKFLSIKKNESGVPLLFYKSAVLEVNFSLSHHGTYGFLAIQS